MSDLVWPLQSVEGKAELGSEPSTLTLPTEALYYPLLYVDIPSRVFGKGGDYLAETMFVNAWAKVCSVCANAEKGGAGMPGGNRFQKILQVMLRNWACRSRQGGVGQGRTRECEMRGLAV